MLMRSKELEICLLAGWLRGDSKGGVKKTVFSLILVGSVVFETGSREPRQHFPLSGLTGDGCAVGESLYFIDQGSTFSWLLLSRMGVSLRASLVGFFPAMGLIFWFIK